MLPCVFSRIRIQQLEKSTQGPDLPDAWDSLPVRGDDVW